MRKILRQQDEAKAALESQMGVGSQDGQLENSLLSSSNVPGVDGSGNQDVYGHSRMPVDDATTASASRLLLKSQSTDLSTADPHFLSLQRM